MIRLFLLILALLLNSKTMQAQDRAAGLDGPAAPISVEIRDLESALMQGVDRTTVYLRIAIRLNITNNSERPLEISRDQFQLMNNGQSIQDGMQQSEPELAKRLLNSGESMEGYVWFSGLKYQRREEPLELVWNPSDVLKVTPAENRGDDSGDDSADDGREVIVDPDKDGADDSGPDEDGSDEKSEQQKGPDQSKRQEKTPQFELRMDLNKVIREMNRVDISAVGPDGCLIIIKAGRLLDTLASWSFGETLEKLAKDGHQRILIMPMADKKVVVMDEFASWLSTMVENSTATPGAASWLPGVDARFHSVAIAECTQAPNRRFYNGRHQVMMYDNVNDAISDALLPLYRFLPVEKALSDLRSPIPGIRRAAMSGTVDRLTEDQAKIVLDQALNGPLDVQLLTVPFLNLIPSRNTIDVLETLCLSENPQVATAAVQSLCACPDDSAMPAMAKVWQASESRVDLRSAVLAAIVSNPDERWVPLAKDYVSRFLEQASDPNVPDIQPTSISGALSLLQGQERIRMANVVQKALLKVENLELQDALLEFLLSTEFPARQKVVRECLSQRVAAKQLSTTTMRAVMLFPDPAWTEVLLEVGKRTENQVSGYANSIRPALACASTAQLEMLLASSDSLDPQQKFEVVVHLSRTNQPGWQQLAATVMNQKDRNSAETVQILVMDSSEESLKVLRDQLVRYVSELEGTQDAAVEGQRYFSVLLSSVAAFSHPECRRVINRLARDPNEWVANAATQQKMMAFRASPAFEIYVTEVNARRAGETEKASELLKRRVETDPFLADSYIRRSSEHLHKMRLTEAMADLVIADQLSPEDIEVYSMIALVKVRLGDVEDGLKLADETITLAPKDWTSVYNGACTYSRATELDSVSAEKKQEYGDKAIQLLEKSADLKFDDYEHMQKDHDLVAIHNHPKWTQTVNRVKANKRSE